jgi:hypothetical protein
MLSVLEELGVLRLDLESLEVELGAPVADLQECPSFIESKRYLEEGIAFLNGLTNVEG